MDSFMNKDLIDTFMVSTKRTNQSLIVLTSAGTIIGKVLDHKLLTEFLNNPESEELDKDKIEYPVSGIITLLHEIQNDRKRDKVSENGIWLKNVTINPNSPSEIHMPVLFVFYDQISGISLGNPE
jgi:hypothetical protein